MSCTLHRSALPIRTIVLECVMIIKHRYAYVFRFTLLRNKYAYFGTQKPMSGKNPSTHERQAR